MLPCQSIIDRSNKFSDDDDLQSLEWLPNFDISRITHFLNSHLEPPAASVEPKPKIVQTPTISVTQKRKPLQCTFSCMIFRAIEESPHRALPLQSIYKWIEDRHPYFAVSGSQWKNSVRHSLSLNQCFIRLRLGPDDDKDNASANPSTSSWWTVHPDFHSAYGPKILAEGVAHTCLPRGIFGAGVKKTSVPHLSTSEHDLAVLAENIKAAATIMSLKEPLSTSNRSRSSEGQRKKKPSKDSQSERRKRKLDHEYVLSHGISEDHRYVSSENKSKRTFTISSLIASSPPPAPSTASKNEDPIPDNQKTTADASVQVCASDFDRFNEHKKFVVSVQSKAQAAVAQKRRSRK